MNYDVIVTKDVGKWKIDHKYNRCSTFPVIRLLFSMSFLSCLFSDPEKSASLSNTEYVDVQNVFQ